MIVKEKDIIEIIKKGQPKFIKEAKEKQAVLNVHVNKRGVEEHLQKVEGFENQEQFELRKKFAISNKFMIANLLRPVDKIFTAKGGSKIYNVSGEKTKKELIKKLQDVRYGYSLRKWIQMIQANKFYSDPSGLVFFEVSKDGLKTYPTIKSIQSIRNYSTEGRVVDWVLFEPFKKYREDGNEMPGEYYRFFDDQYDYIFFRDGDLIKRVEKLENNWEKVPAIVNSNILNDELKYSDSPLDLVIELAEKYLRTNTIKSIHEFLHGFPFFWMYMKKCKSCKGAGWVGEEKCKPCKGTGAVLKKDVSDVMLLNTPKTKDSPTIAPNVAGYVVPPLEIPEEQRTELNFIWMLMSFTMWGTSHEDSENPTATAAFLNVQPKNDSLEFFTDAFQDMEQKMVDLIGEFYYKEAYKGNSTAYGRRYLVEDPEKIWEKYVKAKNNGSPKSTLNHILSQYYQSEFMNDPEMLSIMLKGMKLEPFLHEDFVKLKGLIDDEWLKRKVFFSEWWTGLSEDEVLMKKIDVLKKEFEEFIKGVNLADKELID